jgi:S1-C subfamily serine protease
MLLPIAVTAALGAVAVVSTVASGVEASRILRLLKGTGTVAKRQAALERSRARLALAHRRVSASHRRLDRSTGGQIRKARFRGAVWLGATLASVTGLAVSADWAMREWSGQGIATTKGTGFKVAEGFAVTNEHVAGSCAKIQVEVPGGFEDVKLVTLDETNDLAVITLPAGAGGDPLPVRTAPALRLGETVHTVGFPLTSNLKTGARMHHGTVSGLTGFKNNANEVQFSGEFYSGGSGSALLDERANVVGVASSGLGYYDGFNFAKRSDALANLLRAVQVKTAPERTERWDPATVEDNVLRSVFSVRCEKK